MEAGVRFRLISRLCSTGSLQGSFTAYCSFGFKAPQLLARWVQCREKLLLVALPLWKAHFMYRVSRLSAAKPALPQQSLADPALHFLHCTAFRFTCNQQSLAWAYRLQTMMISGILTCNLPTGDDPEGPEEMFLELCVSTMSCNLMHLQRWCKLCSAVEA